MSEEELNKKIVSLRKEIGQFQNESNAINRKYREMKVNQTNILLSKLNIILSNFADNQKISLIIQKKNIVIGKTQLDITNEIMKIFNSEVKSISN